MEKIGYFFGALSEFIPLITIGSTLVAAIYCWTHRRDRGKAALFTAIFFIWLIITGWPKRQINDPYILVALFFATVVLLIISFRVIRKKR